MRNWQRRANLARRREAILRRFREVRASRPVDSKLCPARPHTLPPKRHLELKTPSLRSQNLAGIQPTSKGASLPPLAVLALNRLGFGPRPGDIDAFNALGGDDASRLQNYVDQQLDPSSIDDSECDGYLAGASFTTLDKTLTQLFQEHALSGEWEIHMRPLWEAEVATYLRALWSRRQLFELMTEFWHNHFSIYAWEEPMCGIWVHYDRDIIRPHALGNFRTMLEEVAKSTEMLVYLDNLFNSLEGPNENYSREMLELHTMGAAAYLGNTPASQVPLDAMGRPIGYVDEDVTAAARCLTGWTAYVWERIPGVLPTGEFEYMDEYHDHDPKTVLGTNLPPNQPDMQDGRDLFDLVASHPATARFIATKLCRKLIGDFPPQSVIDAAAQTFEDAYADSDQIAQVVRTIVLSPEFSTTWGAKIKRPFEITMSALRSAAVPFPFAVRDDLTGGFLWLMYLTGQEMWGWHPPNGYPDVGAAWNSTSPRVMTWNLSNWLCNLWQDDQLVWDANNDTPPALLTAAQIADFWIDRVLGRALGATDRQFVIDFMAQGAGSSTPLDRSDWEVQDRVRALVGLLFMSPFFLER